MIPAHLQTARDITGTLETPGDGDNPVILGWVTEIGRRFPDMASYARVYVHDSIPWCGLTVAYCLAANGIRPVFGPTDTDKFLWARAWARFGTAVSDPEPGDILVFSGHVSFYEGTEGVYYLCRGGNQSDAVTVARYPKDTVIAIRRAPAPTGKKTVQLTSSKRQTGITATVFGGSEDPNQSAYDEHEITENELGVALPYRFQGARPRVRVWRNGRSVECTIVDVGPWNTADPYWETGRRPQAESGTDLSGRSTNGAGIDLTPAAAAALGVQGKGTVDWEFIGEGTGAGEAPLVTWTKRIAETVSTAAISWAGTLQLTDKQSLFNLSVACAVVVLGIVVWMLVHKLDKMIQATRKPVGPPLHQMAPPAPPRSMPMNPIFGALLQQVLGAVLNGMNQPAQPSQPGVPAPVPTAPSNGTVESFLKNLLSAVLLAAAAEVMKELPRLMTPQQNQ